MSPDSCDGIILSISNHLVLLLSLFKKLENLLPDNKFPFLSDPVGFAKLAHGLHLVLMFTYFQFKWWFIGARGYFDLESHYQRRMRLLRLLLLIWEGRCTRIGS